MQHNQRHHLLAVFHVLARWCSEACIVPEVLLQKPLPKDQNSSIAKLTFKPGFFLTPPTEKIKTQGQN